MKAILRRFSRLQIVAFSIASLFLSASVMLALARRPSCDEAWFAGAAWSLAFQGFMGTPVLEWRGTGLDGLDRHTYWIMPLHPVSLALWYRLAGFSLFTSRLHSILWGFFALLALFSIVRDLTRRSDIGVAAMAIAGIDYAFLRGASDARMDMMALALGLMGLAAYLRWAPGHMKKALILSESLIAAGIFVHPNGVLSFGLLHAYIFFKDRQRLDRVNIAWAILPYLACAAAWGIYIAQEPKDFLAQMAYNTKGRGSFLGKPLLALENGMKNVLLAPFGFGGTWAGWIVRLKLLILAVYLGSCVAASLIPSLRRYPGVRPMLAAAVIVLVGLSIQMSFNANDYVIFLIPWFAGIMAVTFIRWLENRTAKPLAFAILGIFSLLQLGGVAARVRKNDYQNEYAAAVRALNTHRGPDDLVMGSAELGFLLGFDSRLVDDWQLGSLTGQIPRFIVVEHRYRSILQGLPAKDSVRAAALQGRLDRYKPIYNHGFFEIYAL